MGGQGIPSPSQESSQSENVYTALEALFASWDRGAVQLERPSVSS